MPDFTLKQVKAATGAEVYKAADSSFTDVVTDTRKIEKGMLFVALKGEKFNGDDFAAQAVEKGAAGVAVSMNCPVRVMDGMLATVFRVENTLLAYQQLAHAWRTRFTIPVIAVTGSNGKTTTKDLIAAILSSRWNVLKTQKNFNNEIGLPLTLLQMRAHHEAAVVEMGMRGFNQITALAKIAEPKIGIVTNVGETHMELLGSLENIAKAKAEMVKAIPAEGSVILNADDRYVAAMKMDAKAKVLTFGLELPADVKGSEIRTEGKKTRFHCLFGKNDREFILPMVGRHNIYNALAAIAVAFSLGFNGEEIQRGLDGFTATEMRFEYKNVKDYKVIDDSYNASPMSMRAAINTLIDIAPGRKIAVLGDMLELGKASVQAHENVGRELAEGHIDAVVTRGQMSKNIAKAACDKGMKHVFSCDSHKEAAHVLHEILQPGDTILFKGSRGMQMEKIIDLL
jgi:UDP-N-acetylmuramoyl-tripeptide--D-alanyl-D-alanine ligase/murE/murF fusion protein